MRATIPRQSFGTKIAKSLLGAAALAISSGTAGAAAILGTGWAMDAVSEAGSGTVLATTTGGAFGDRITLGQTGYTGEGALTNPFAINGSNIVTTRNGTEFSVNPTANNAFVGDVGGTLTLTTPSSYESLQFLTFGIGGNFSATVNFSDTTTTILSVAIPDWQGSVPAAGTVTNAFTTTTTQIVDGRNATATTLQERWMRELTFDLSATDQQKTIASITFADGVAGDRFGIIGVSGVVPEPSSLSLLGLGGLLALRRRR